MLAPALALALMSQAATSPPSEGDVVVVSAAWPGIVTPELANRIETQVRAVVARAGLTLVPADAVRRAPLLNDACKNDRPCLGKLAASLGGYVTLRIEPASVGKEVAIVFEVISAKDGTLGGDDSFSLTIGTVDKELPAHLGKIIELLRSTCSKAKTPVVVVTPDIPLAHPIDPPPPLPPLTVADPIVIQKSRPAGVWILGAGAVAAGVTSAIFGGLAAQSNAQFKSTLFSSRGMNATTYTQAQLDAAVTRTNTDATISLAAGIGAGVFALVAVILALTQ